MKRVLRHGPLVLHAALGAAVFTRLGLSPACGEDECLRTLGLVVFAVAWSLAAAVALLSRRRPIAWIASVVWIPLAWLATLALFSAFPSLGGA